MSKNIPTVVITKMTPRWRPFQIFILGFYELERLGEIKLKFRCDWFYRISTILPDLPHLGGVMHQLAVFFLRDAYNMEGYVELNGKRRTFCIDSSDSPSGIDGEALNRVDIYFKTQCPKEIDLEKGFRISDDFWCPYYDHEQVDPKLKRKKRGERRLLITDKKNMAKIKPCVVGFRRLADGNSYVALRNGWENYRKGALKKASKKVMCYFGNAYGPKRPDEAPYDLDSDYCMLHYYPTLSHPNEKRAKIAEIMEGLGEQYDARLINKGTMEHPENNQDLVIPIDKFCAHISNFQYNYNVSGIRLSIPNRFMESFMVGTAIITDKLAVKWYLPFEDEVIETVEMGYLPMDSIDWEQAKKDLLSLPDISKQKVLEQYEKKWAPIPIARYMVKTVLDS